MNKIKHQSKENWFSSLAISVLAHILLVTALPETKQSISRQSHLESIKLHLIDPPNRRLSLNTPSNKDPEKKEKPPDLSLPKNQIVSSPSSQPEVKSIKATRLLSDRDLSTDREQIKRGDPTPQKYPAKPSMTKTPSKSAEVENIASINDLFLDNKKLKKSALLNHRSQETSPTQSERDYSSENKTFGFNDFTGKQGSRDFLPDLPDGEVTLLNAKAHRYALFVRRVAEKVFGELRVMHWNSVGTREILQTRDSALVIASMSKSGQLLSVKVQNSSGSTQFDQAVLKAVERGAWDSNPPVSAANDRGNIDFIFQSRIWSSNSPNQPAESRWLFLGTGLL